MIRILSLILLIFTISCNEPDYNTRIPDTKGNKDCFVRYLNTKPSDDVKDIYCYADYLGGDHMVLISFYCDSSTVQKIVSEKQMSKANEKGGGLIFGEEFKWWDKKRIEIIIPFQEGRRYIWYDSLSKRAYYLEFSI